MAPVHPIIFSLSFFFLILIIFCRIALDISILITLKHSFDCPFFFHRTPFNFVSNDFIRFFFQCPISADFIISLNNFMLVLVSGISYWRMKAAFWLHHSSLIAFSVPASSSLQKCYTRYPRSSSWRKQHLITPLNTWLQRHDSKTDTVSVHVNRYDLGLVEQTLSLLRFCRVRGDHALDLVLIHIIFWVKVHVKCRPQGNAWCWVADTMVVCVFELSGATQRQHISLVFSLQVSRHNYTTHYALHTTHYTLHTTPLAAPAAPESTIRDQSPRDLNYNLFRHEMITVCRPPTLTCNEEVVRTAAPVHKQRRPVIAS